MEPAVTLLDTVVVHSSPPFAGIVIHIEDGGWIRVWWRGTVVEAQTGDWTRLWSLVA